ncbi:DUF4233 domain-containing protein [Actinokineospora auranticolor]|uniref:Uncharacterized protein DUF4233 n=1 Tax=Actinokineospora auranticolor TaxID=155976 RepID=A0A2S6GV18_9PSEU|nr:DUF4233 domain-containing protein [Actinokineospora auranticolor]PPK69054.1 uncharacterized protein DUF4233 [Actinokineospora auranticolor]
MSAPDPMKSFRGVMSALLILEAIVVLLALLVVTKSDIASWRIWSVVALALAMVLACAFVSRPWATWMVIALQVLAIAGFFVLTALGVVGVLFALAWSWALWARNDIRKRMTQGTLPSQQQ